MNKQYLEYSPISISTVDELPYDFDTRATFGSSILTLISTCVGSGLIAMPFAVAQLGLIHGLLWMLICIFIVIFSLHCLSITACSLSGHHTSYFLAAEKYAPRLRVSVDLSIILQGWGVCVSYLILIGNSIPSLVLFIFLLFNDEPLDDFSFFGFDPRQFSICCTMIFVLFPLCCQKSLRALKITTLVSIISVIYILLMIISYFLLYLINSEESIFSTIQFIIIERMPISLWKWSIKGILTSVPIFIFSLTCHHNLFNVYNELKPPRDVSKLNKVSFYSISTVGIIYFLIASAGYITLGDKVDSKLFDSYEYGDLENRFFSEFSIILNQIDPNHCSLFVGRLCLLLIVISAFPIQFYPIKISIYNLWISLSGYLYSNDQGSELLLNQETDPGFPVSSSDPLFPKDPIQSESFHYLVTLLYCLICLILSLSITEFGIVLSIVGATGDNYIAIFFGPYIYLMLSRDGFMRSRYYWKEICAYILIGFSAVLGIVVVFYI